MTFWKMIFLLQNCILRFHVIFFAGCSLENATSLFVGSILAARQIYEKRLIEKHISDSGQCPVTKEELHEEKLTALRVTIFRFWNLGVLSWFRFWIEKGPSFVENPLMIHGSTCSQEDLCDMKVNKVVKPRPATATSIPGMLQGGLVHGLDFSERGFYTLPETNITPEKKPPQ